MSSERRRVHVSPRPHKRLKCDDKEKSPEDDNDGKPRAEKPLLDSLEGECIEELLTRFQKLLFHTSDINHESHEARFTIPNLEQNHLDLHHRKPSQDLPHTYDNKYGALEKALHAIAVHDKVDYMTAIHVAPELALQESDPSRFLSFHDYNAEKAAQCIVQYWKQRRALFGDRAFLPTTLTGNGALNAEDIQLLKCGNVALTGQDQQGSTEMVFDPSRRTAEDHGIRLKASFYTWQVLLENPINQNIVLMTPATWSRTYHIGRHSRPVTCPIDQADLPHDIICIRQSCMCISHCEWDPAGPHFCSDVNSEPSQAFAIHST